MTMGAVGDSKTPSSIAEAKARGIGVGWTIDPKTGESAPAGETPEARRARKAIEGSGRAVGSGLGPSPAAIPAAPDLTDELLQKSAAGTVARLRRGMGRRSTFLNSAIGDSTLLGEL
jgi:hypothetical protein